MTLVVANATRWRGSGTPSPTGFGSIRADDRGCQLDHANRHFQLPVAHSQFKNSIAIDFPNRQLI
jgi:hypothetical protein